MGVETGALDRIERSHEQIAHNRGLALNHDIVTWSAVEDVEPRAAEQDIVAGAAEQGVGTVAADQDIVTRAAIRGELDPTCCKPRRLDRRRRRRDR